MENMKEVIPGVELPLASSTALPFMPLYKSSLPRLALISIAVLMVSTAGLIVSPTEGGRVVIAIFFLLEILSIVAIVLISVKTSKKKQETWSFLDTEHKAFADAVAARYGVIITETILYQLAQGGNTLLTDKNGDLTRIMIESDPVTQTTKLVVSGKP